MHVDSNYVKDGITKWIHGWKKNGWKTADKKPVKNMDLWQRLDAALKPHEVRWHWVKGHAGHPENERADALAELRALAELCMGGLGRVSLTANPTFAHWPWQLNVHSCNPILSCLGSQYAGWSLQHAYEKVPHYRKAFDAARTMSAIGRLMISNTASANNASSGASTVVPCTWRAAATPTTVSPARSSASHSVMPLASA